MRLSRYVAASGAAVLLVGCTSRPVPRPDETAVMSAPAPTGPSHDAAAPAVPGPFPLAGSNARPQSPSAPLPADEIDGSCPYLKAGLNIEPDATGTNFADLEGNRVQRVTRLTNLKPVGCRFYFQRDYHPTGDILPSTYSSAVDAYDAMVATSQAGTSAEGVPSFVPGVDGISFRTRLNSPDAGQDWAFAFAKGDVMVVIRTDQTNTSANAKDIAQAIVNEF